MKLYHGTSRDNLALIKKEGLIPSAGLLGASKEIDEKIGFIYFSTDKIVAKQFNAEVIIEVDTDDLDEKKLGSYRERLCDIIGCDDFYHYQGRISPDKLKIIKE